MNTMLYWEKIRILFLGLLLLLTSCSLSTSTVPVYTDTTPFQIFYGQYEELTHTVYVEFEFRGPYAYEYRLNHSSTDLVVSGLTHSSPLVIYENLPKSGTLTIEMRRKGLGEWLAVNVLIN